MNRFLRYARRSLAVVVGVVSLLFFLDIRHAMPDEVHAIFHLQVVPALMGGAIAILIAIALITLLLGRVYCSVLCPLGIMQDAILRVKKWWTRLRHKRKSLRIKYSKPYNILRYSILAGVSVLFAIGISLPLAWLDPYSNFGRIATSLFRPVAVWANNLSAGIANSAGNFSIYKVQQLDPAWIVVGFSVVVLVALTVMVWRRERLWCNTVCPVGAALGLLSRFSLFRIAIASESCNSCTRCASACKAECIDAKQKTVDHSRCVTCYNCLAQCNQGAISYRFRRAKQDVPAKPHDPSRRRFLKGSAALLGTLAAGKLAGSGRRAVNGGGEPHRYEPDLRERTIAPLPPGAVSRERFERTCTACQLCVSKCPTHVLQPAFLENGLTGMMQPYMRFKVESFCNYECTVCMDICPNHAITPLAPEEKKLTRVGFAHFMKEACIVYTEDQDCGACAEHCPTAAVHMIPYKGTLTIPEVRPDYCIGCGGCESICPVFPAAIFVQGLHVQERATPPSVEKIDADPATFDFGF